MTARQTQAPSPEPSSDENFRTRAAREKRQRMRERLLAATMTAYLHGQPGRSPVIDDVIRAAEVSRGTFYKYYDTLDDLLAEIGQRMAKEMIATFDQLFGALHDPAVQVAAGPLMALARAVMDPAHGAVISHVDMAEHLGDTDPRRQLVIKTLQHGLDKGVFRFHSLEAACDLVLGTTVEGARRLALSRRLDGAYLRETIAMVLTGLGQPRPDAVAAVNQAWQLLQAASHQLTWWKPLQAI